MRRTWIGVLVATGLASSSPPAHAQEERPIDSRVFRDAPYYEPLLAEPRPARTMLLIPAWSKAFPHSVQPGSRFAWQISLGDEFPIVKGQEHRLFIVQLCRKWDMREVIPERIDKRIRGGRTIFFTGSTLRILDYAVDRVVFLVEPVIAKIVTYKQKDDYA